MKKKMISILTLGLVVGGLGINAFANEKKVAVEPTFKVVGTENNLQTISDQEISKDELKGYTKEEMIQYCINNMNLTPEEAEIMAKEMNNSGGCIGMMNKFSGCR